MDAATYVVEVEMAIARRLISSRSASGTRQHLVFPQRWRYRGDIPTTLSTSCCLHFCMIPADGSPRGRIGNGRGGSTVVSSSLSGEWGAAHMVQEQPLLQPWLGRSEEYIPPVRWGIQQWPFDPIVLESPG